MSDFPELVDNGDFVGVPVGLSIEKALLKIIEGVMVTNVVKIAITRIFLVVIFI